MTSTVKRQALQQLVDYLRPIVGTSGPLGSVGIPDDAFYVGDQGTTGNVCFPNLVARAAGSEWTFVAFNDDEMWSTDTTQTVQVGDLSGTIELVLGATNPDQREVIEDAILSTFYRQTDQNGFYRTGVLVVQLDPFLVDRQLNLLPVPIGYCLQQESWDEEMVFERKRYSHLTLAVDLPALVTRSNVYDIDTLILALSNDLAATLPTDEIIVLDDGGAENVSWDPGFSAGFGS